MYVTAKSEPEEYSNLSEDRKKNIKSEKEKPEDKQDKSMFHLTPEEIIQHPVDELEVLEGADGLIRDFWFVYDGNDRDNIQEDIKAKGGKEGITAKPIGYSEMTANKEEGWKEEWTYYFNKTLVGRRIILSEALDRLRALFEIDWSKYDEDGNPIEEEEVE